jgi:hypothetical protein
MPKRKGQNEIAFAGLQDIIRRDAERDAIPQQPIPPPQKVPSALKADRLGGLKGGKARAASLTPRKRKSDCEEKRLRFAGLKNQIAKLMALSWRLWYKLIWGYFIKGTA